MSGIERLSAVAGAAGGLATLDSTGAVPVAQLASAGKYDKRVNVYNQNAASFRRGRAALAKAQAGTGICHIAVIGTSISTVSGSLTTVAQTWPQQLVGLLAGKGYTAGGTGLVPAGNRPAAETRWTTTGTWGAQSNHSALLFSSTATSTATFTSDKAGTTVDLFMLNNSGGFSYSIDGGGAVTPSAGTGTLTVRKISTTGLANTTHTIVVTANSGTVFIVGARVGGVNGTVEVTNLGVSGNTATDAAGVSGAYTGYASPAVAVAAEADIVFVELLTNDGGPPVPAASITYMQAIIDALTPTASVVLLTEPPRGDASSTLPAAIQTAIYALADTNGLAVVDLYDRLGTEASTSALGLGFTDHLHFTVPGHSDISRAVGNVIG